MSKLSDALLAMAKVGDGNVPFVMAEDAANEITELEQQLAAIPEDLGKCGQDLWDCADKLTERDKLLDECEEYFAWLHDGEQIVEPIFASDVLLTKLQERDSDE